MSGSGAAAALRLQGISFRRPRGGFRLAPLDVAADPGEVVGLLGPNGAGKSTVLRIAAGLLRPEAGRVLLFGQDASSLSPPERARLAGWIGPGARFEFPLPVRELALQGRFARLRGLRLPGTADLEAADRALERAGIAVLADRDVRTLSTGERQRALLARVLAQEPRILLLDEPTASQDLAHQAEFPALLRSLAAEGLATLLVSHDLNLAAAACDRLVLLRDGDVVASGPPEAVFRPEVLAAAFGARVLVDRHPQSGRPRVTLAAGAPDASAAPPPRG